MLQQTTALRKISGLKKRIWVIQGGQGAGKTFSILILIANYAQRNPDKEIFIASQELTKMRITVIKDFINVLKSVGIYEDDRFIAGTFYRFRSGSFIKFIGLDKEDLGKGLRSDLVFVNEANKVSFEAYRELTSRAKRVIIDFNPNGEFWAHKEVLNRNDVDFLTLAYPDNELLSEEEKAEIILNKHRAYYDPNLEDYDTEANTKSKYWRNKWIIYGLGKIGSNPHRIFEWNQISLDQYNKVPSQEYYGVDWGAVDPWGIVAVKYDDGCLYLRERNYASENEIKSKLSQTELHQVGTDEEGLVGWHLKNRLNLPKKAYYICDDNRPKKVLALRGAGYDYAITAAKGEGSIEDGIELLEKLKVYYTDDSPNLHKEQQEYSRQLDRNGIVLSEPIDSWNHLIDPTRYVASFLRAQGIIKVI